MQASTRPASSIRPALSGPASTWRACLALASAALLSGCGTPGAPQPPSLKLPTPPADLSASRSGDVVTLRWTMPRRATDRVLLSGDQRAVICRGVESAASADRKCQPAGESAYRPGIEAIFADTLPADLRNGSPRLLTYTVLLENPAGRSSGPSNPAFTAAGAAPPALRALEVKAEAQGIVLSWQGGPEGGLVSKAVPPGQGRTDQLSQDQLSQAHASQTPGSRAQGDQEPSPVGRTGIVHLLRLHRTRIFAPGESSSPGTAEIQAGLPQPIEQTLEVKEAATEASTLAEAWPLTHSIDREAALNRTYRYTVEQVARLTIGGHLLEVSGGLSAPVAVNARDLFPPAVPQGLVAVADSEATAIDLSWTANTEEDLAGYAVYRRIASSTGMPLRVSGSAPLANPSWRDAAPEPGVRYAYSVSASDNSGNQSGRSPEAEEMVRRR